MDIPYLYILLNTQQLLQNQSNGNLLQAVNF